MKIFFIINVPSNIPWSLKMFPVMYVTIFPRKTMKIHVFSYQSATVGLPIVNQPYHAHDRALHCDARRPVNFKVMVLCGYWLPEALLEICHRHGDSLASCSFPGYNSWSNGLQLGLEPPSNINFMLGFMTCSPEPDHVLQNHAKPPSKTHKNPHKILIDK